MLEKINGKDSWKTDSYCRDPEHDPPGMIVLENGDYKHTCPACGKVAVFSVRNPTLCVL